MLRASATGCDPMKPIGTGTRVKRALAQREWRFVQDYADAKTPVIREIIERMGMDQ